MWWCQPTQLRTSYCPSPTSPFPAPNTSSIRCRVNRTRTSSDSGTSGPALLSA